MKKQVINKIENLKASPSQRDEIFENYVSKEVHGKSTNKQYNGKRFV